MSRARAAVTAVFFLNGMVFVSWYSRLPSIQDKLDLGTGTLGLVLFGAPLGMLIAQPLTGALAASVGSRPLVIAAPLLLLAGITPALAVDAPTLALATLTVGAANGVLDVSMNVEGLAVERSLGRREYQDTKTIPLRKKTAVTAARARDMPFRFPHRRRAEPSRGG